MSMLPALPGAAPAEMYLGLALQGAGKAKGECQAPGHEGDIQVLGWAWGAAADMAVGGSAANARRSYASLQVFKALDTATTVLLTALKKNDEVREARLVLRKPGGEQVDFFELRLKKARVARIDYEPHPSGTVIEKVSFTFAQVEVEYWPQGSGGAAGPSHSFEDEL